MKAVIPDHIVMSDTVRSRLLELDVVIHDDTPNQDQLIERIRDAELITVNYFDMTKELIDAAPKLRYIVVPAVGFEWVDYRYAAQKGIKVLNCPTFNGAAVAEHALALLLALRRRILEANISLRAGEWKPKEFVASELAGKQLGIIGYGKIGKQVGKLAEAFGMDVSGIGSKATTEEWDTLLSQSDVLCVVLPTTESTHHIIDAAKLAKTKPGAMLINVGRGVTIDTDALIHALQSGQLAGAGIDVFENEPMDGTIPSTITSLSALPNVVATPHIAYNTKEAAHRLGDELVENIKACIAGQPTNVVN